MDTDADARHGPVSLLELCVKKQQEEWRRFHSRLGEDFPHTFHLDNEHRQMEKTHLAKLRKGLESALGVGYKTALETARAKNYKAFLLSCDGRWLEGLTVTEEALREEGERHNLVSLANTAVILWNMGRYGDAQKQLDMLEEVKADHADFDYLKVKAKAELAFTCTRMGPAFYAKAIALFQEVLEKARGPEKWLWTFGLGLTRRRSLHLLIAPLYTGQDASGESTKALDAFLTVINNSDSRNLRAKAYVEIAMLNGRMVWDKKEKERLAQRAGMWPNVACEKALELDDTDNSVLCKAARILRKDKYIDNFKHLPYTGPVDLLQKALDIRPSSTAFHHLGLNYKAQARERYMTGQVNSGESYTYLLIFRIFFQATSIFHQIITYVQILFLALWQPPALGQQARDVQDTQGILPDNTHSERIQEHLIDPEVFKLARALKSPIKCMLLPKSDPMVTKTMECFEAAYDLSMGTNKHALYDLALMHRYVGDLDKALKLLEELRHRTREHPNYLTVNAFEQSGFVLLEKNEAERDDQKKKQLAAEAESMFYRALEKGAQLYSKNPQFRGRVGEVWNSFVQLIKNVDESDMSDEEKLVRKAELFLQISDTQRSMALLEQLKQQSPCERRNPRVLRLCVHNYVSTSEFEKALALIEILASTPGGSATIAEQFSDKDYVRKLRVRAARQALLNNNLSDSSEHFYSAFIHTFTLTQAEEGTSSSDTEPSSEGERETWDVMVVYDRLTAALRDESQHKAEVLVGVLKTVCGLKVTVMDEAGMLGQPSYDILAHVMKRSRLVLVLAGQSKFSTELRLLVSLAATRTGCSLVTLLAHGDHGPVLLRPFPRVECQATELLAPHGLGSDDAARAGYSEASVTAICRLFTFLVGL